MLRNLLVIMLLMFFTANINAAEPKERNHRVYSLVGFGYNGEQSTLKVGDTHSVSSDKGNLLGVGYMYGKDRGSIGVQYINNGTIGMTLGLDF